MDFARFILEHEHDDPARLALDRERYACPDFDLLLSTLEARRKLRDKVPQWLELPDLRFPSRLSAEQCSSAETARYKASVAASLAARTSLRIADLTGGLGVDSWAFSELFSEVLYNEMNPLLADAARHNFARMGIRNITVRQEEVGAGRWADMLDDFKPDVLYLDPARRAADGRKVFRIENCRPDLLSLLPELFRSCPRLLLKLSPMADISLVCKQLGPVREVHVVAAGGECKELLLVLERDAPHACEKVVYESGAVLRLRDAAGDDSVSYAAPEDLHGFLFEPGKALLKAGAFDWPSRAFGLRKIARHTHLYLSAGAVPEDLARFGKCFMLREAVPLNKAGIRYMAGHYPAAEVSARNLPLTSEELRRKLKVRSGGEVHIFGVHTDTPPANYLLAAVPCKASIMADATASEAPEPPSSVRTEA